MQQISFHLSNNQTLDVPSNLVQFMRVLPENNEVQQPYISRETMQKVVDFARRYADMTEAERRVWEREPGTLEAKLPLLAHWVEEFFRVDIEKKAQLANAAHRLGFKALVEHCAHRLAKAIADRSPEELATFLK